MNYSGGVSSLASRGGGELDAVWAKASAALKTEMSQDTFNSWLGQAGVRENAAGELYLVTPTGIARDWVRRYAWRRVTELWSQYDPQRRALELKSRAELETGAPASDNAVAAPKVPLQALAGPAVEEAVATTCEGVTRAPGLQERFRFDTFVPGPANEFAHSVAKRVAGWSDGHFNPVVFHGPYGFGKTHLLNALAWEDRKSVV